MLFNSYLFLPYLAFVLSVFFWVGRSNPTWAAAWLAMASFAFYAIGEYVSVDFAAALMHTLILAASVAFNYLAGLLIHRASTPATRRWRLAAAVSVDLALLGYFKYANFFLHVVGIDVRATSGVLPLGISFYAFTQVAYLVDISRGRVKEFSAVYYALFVSYFPHLIAGPIIHHAEMIPQFRRQENYYCKWSNLAVGVSIFAFGLAKKALIADGAAPYADQVFSAVAQGNLSVAECWVGELAYTIQIYFDFSAYTDMAIGVSKMIGFTLPMNFNSPYKATSIVDFWHRWHMTLSRFLRDYLYIPLGGNRHGLPRRYVNLLLTMLLGGLWHGAGWTFVIWGSLHGVYLIVNHMWHRFGGCMPNLAGFAFTFIAVVFAWVFFRADNLASALAMTRGMLGLAHAAYAGSGLEGGALFPNMGFEPAKVSLVIGLPLLIAWAMPNVPQLFATYAASLDAADLDRPPFGWRPRVHWALACGALLAIGIIAMGQQSPFLYFRF
jgi:alginate O-acetyltransferase complex protein AlgI